MAKVLDLSDPAQAEEWYLSLPAPVQSRLAARLTTILRTMPEALRAQVSRSVVASAGMLPIPLEGVYLANPKCITSARGLGQWGAVITAVTQFGGTVLTAKMNASTSESIANTNATTDYLIAQARLEAEKQTNAALIQAQRDAAVIAGRTTVAVAQIGAGATAEQQAAYEAKGALTKAFTTPTGGMSGLAWLALGLGGLLVAGGTTFFVVKSRRKS
jgi:hypothetical protein